MDNIIRCETCKARNDMWQRRINHLKEVNSIKITWDKGGTEFSAAEGFPFPGIVELVTKSLEGYLDGCCSKCIKDLK